MVLRLLRQIALAHVALGKVSAEIIPMYRPLGHSAASRWSSRHATGTTSSCRSPERSEGPIHRAQARLDRRLAPNLLIEHGVGHWVSYL